MWRGATRAGDWGLRSGPRGPWGISVWTWTEPALEMGIRTWVRPRLPLHHGTHEIEHRLSITAQDIQSKTEPLQ